MIDRRSLLRLVPQYLSVLALSNVAKAKDDPAPEDDRFPGGISLAGEGWDRNLAADLSPDGKLVAAGGRQGEHRGSLRVWSATSGEVVATWHGHEYAIYAVAFSADGKWIASSAPFGRVRDESIPVFKARHEGAEVKIWEAGTGRLIGTIRTGGIAEALAFSPSGELITSIDLARNLSFWEIDTGRPVLTLGKKSSGHVIGYGPVRREWLAFDADGRRAVAVGNEPIPVEVPTGEALFPEGNVPLPKSSEPALKTFDVDAARRKSLQVGRWIDSVSSLTLSPDGRRIIVGGNFEDRARVLVLDFETGELVDELKIRADGLRPVTFLAVSPDGEQVVCAGHETPERRQVFFQIWDLSSGELLEDLASPQSDIRGVAFLANRLRVLTGGGGSFTGPPNPLLVWEVDRPDRP